MNIKTKKLTETAIIPTRGSDEAAGLDLYADCNATINPGERVMIGTGIAMAIPKGCFGGVFARSGLAFKEGIRPSNCVGVIDSDYRGEIKVAVTNDSSEIANITAGERIAQLVIIPYIIDLPEEVSELDETDRGDGGFGHTGKN